MTDTSDPLAALRRAQGPDTPTRQVGANPDADPLAALRRADTAPAANATRRPVGPTPGGGFDLGAPQRPASTPGQSVFGPVNQPRNNAAAAGFVTSAALPNVNQRAEERRLANSLGVPQGAIAGAPDAFAALGAQREATEILERSPATSAWLLIPGNADLAADDVGVLAAIETAMTPPAAVSVPADDLRAPVLATRDRLIEERAALQITLTQEGLLGEGGAAAQLRLVDVQRQLDRANRVLSAREPVFDPFADETFGDTATRRGQEVTQGFSGVLQSVAMRRSINATTLDYALRTQAPEQVQELVRQADVFAEVLDGGLSPMSGEAMTDDERATFQQRYDDAVVGVEAWADLQDFGISDPDERQGGRTAAALQAWTDETFGVPPEDDSIWSDLAQGVGSMGAFMLPSMLGPFGLVGTAQMGADAAAVEAYDRALAHGATRREAEVASQFAGFMGTSEALPIAAAFRYLPPALQSDVMSRIGRTVMGAAEGSVEEAIQEIGRAHV